MDHSHPPPAQLGEDSHKALARAEHKLRAAEATKITAEKWLKRADYQVRVVHLGRSTCRAISGRGGQSTRIPDSPGA